MIKYTRIKNVTIKTYDIIAQHFVALMDDKNASKEEIESMEKFISLLPQNAIVVDLGCGVGKHGRYCAKKGDERHKNFTVYGFDISKRMIERAEQYNNEKKYSKITVDKQDMCDFNIDKKLDAVIIAYSLIHLDKEHAAIALQNVKKHLNKNAYIWITVYHGDRNGFQREGLSPQNKLFYRDYEDDEFKSLVEDAGYKIVDFTKWKDTDPITGGDADFDTGVLCITAQYCGK